MTARRQLGEQEPRPCRARMDSRVQPGHVHACSGNHEDGDDHLCPRCGRRWQRGRPARSHPGALSR